MSQVTLPAPEVDRVAVGPSEPARAHSGQRWAPWQVDAILVAAISLFGLLLRVRQLGARSLWVDEGAGVAIARLPWGEFLQILWRREGNMALYYLILRGWMQLGSSEAVLRGFSVICAVLSIPALYLLGKRLFGRGAGIMAALLLAVNAFHIRYSQEARSYALLVLVVILCSYLFLIAVESPSPGKWMLWAAVSALAEYIHLFAVLITVAQVASLAFLGIRRIPWRNLRIGLESYAFMILPVPVFVWNNWYNHQLDWVPVPDINSLYSFAELFAGEGGRLLLWAYLACVVAAVALLAKQWERHDDSPSRFRLGLVVSWLLLPIAMSLAATILKPVFVPRYMTICLPALALLGAQGITMLRARWRIAALLILAGLALQGARNPYARDIGPGENWRAAVQYFTASAMPNDAFFLNNGIGRPVLEYYGAQAVKDSSLRILFPYHGEAMTFRDFEGIPNALFVEKRLSRMERFWVLEWYASPSVDGLLESGFQRVQLKQFPGVTVSLYVNRNRAAQTPQSHGVLAAVDNRSNTNPKQE